MDPLEARLGMGPYVTRTPGIGGRLRTTPEDFEVDEVPRVRPASQGEGKYTFARIRARNWETNRLMQEIRRRLDLSPGELFFAGTKDKRAVTTQYVSLRASEERVRALGIRDVEVLETMRVDRAPKIGELVGNRFRLVVRATRMPADEAARIAGETVDELRAAAGGMPNYFGPQRFGALRPVTHDVGDRILRGDLDGAVDTYVGNPMEGEPADTFAARSRYAAERDPAAALAYYPPHMSFERSMLRVLAEGGTAEQALRSLPRNLVTMFVSAAQSLLFNRILSRRLARGLPLAGAVPGDLVCSADEDGLPDRERWFPVTEANAEKLSRRVAAGKAFVGGLVPGRFPEYAEGPMGEIEREVVRETGLAPEAFGAPALPEAGSTGTRRELTVPLRRVDVSLQAPDGVVLEFFLPRGAYATCLLREIMKAPVTSL